MIDFDIETQFQGRQMQSNVTSLISNQIRKAIRRKHTFPNYKLRYKPFFHKSAEEDYDVSDIVLDGNIEVNIAELTRLSFSCNINHVFGTLTLAPIAWVTARQHDDKNIVIVLDVEIHKAKNQQIGIIFKQSDAVVLVENVIPNTPAMKANIAKGDTLISIEGKKINNINHIAKIVKGLNRPVFVMRIERIIPGLLRSDAPSPPMEDSPEGSYEDVNEATAGGSASISFSKNADSVQIGGRTRQNSLDKASSDSSRSNTPTNSPSKSREGIFNRARGKIRSNMDGKSTAEDDGLTKNNGGMGKVRKDSEWKGKPIDENSFQQHVTVECLVNSFITMNDISKFKLNQNAGFFNLNIFGRCNGKCILLGYLNIPVMTVLAECIDSTLGHFVKQFTLNPPDTPNL